MDVTGIDVSEGLLAHARRQVPGARFVRADLFDQELDIGPFDAVVSFYSLVDLTADMFIAALERLRDLTVTGGTLLVAVSERRTDDEVRFMDTSYRPALCRREDLGDWARQAGLWVDELNICPEQGAEGQPETGLYLWARRFRDSPRPGRSRARGRWPTAEARAAGVCGVVYRPPRLESKVTSRATGVPGRSSVAKSRTLSSR